MRRIVPPPAKRLIKRCVVALASPITGAVLVNSYGRSGSSMLTRAVARAASGNGIEALVRVREKSIQSTAWDLNRDPLRSGFVYKTHDYPPATTPTVPVRTLYAFADPIDVVLSLMRLYETGAEDHMRVHYAHLRAPYTDFADIVHEDQLRLEAHFDRWREETRFPVAFVRYDDLWREQGRLGEFLGLPLTLPPRRDRLTQTPPPKLRETLERTYASLAEKVRHGPGFWTNRA